mmetsp:Transcript_84233/g.192082  ORF Transcript_84233/g.192082 Transcript_84233/m.192082 type:complete len:919 (+) Transcript_84233:1-2757(+)
MTVGPSLSGSHGRGRLDRRALGGKLLEQGTTLGRDWSLPALRPKPAEPVVDPQVASARARVEGLRREVAFLTEQVCVKRQQVPAEWRKDHARQVGLLSRETEILGIRVRSLIELLLPQHSESWQSWVTELAGPADAPISAVDSLPDAAWSRNSNLGDQLRRKLQTVGLDSAAASKLLAPKMNEQILMAVESKLQRKLQDLKAQIITVQGDLERTLTSVKYEELAISQLESQQRAGSVSVKAQKAISNEWREDTELLSSELSTLGDIFPFLPNPDDSRMEDIDATDSLGHKVDGGGVTRESLVQLRTTLYRFVKENQRLLQAVKKAQQQKRFFEVKYKGTAFEMTRTQRSGKVADAWDYAHGAGSKYGPLEPGEQYKGVCVDERSDADLEFVASIVRRHGEFPWDSVHRQSNERRNKLITFLCREFATYCDRCHALYSLVEDLQELHTFRDLDLAMRFLIDTICRSVRAARATCWMLDERRGIAWTKTAKGSGLADITVDLNSGFIGACYRERRPINVADAYADPRFNRELDKQSGYRTKAVLCVPCIAQGEVRAIMQVVNKISASSSSFGENDANVLTVLGHSMVETLAVVEKHGNSTGEKRRQDIVLDAVDSMFYEAHSKRHFLQVCKDRIAQLFKASSSAIFLCHKDFLSRQLVSIDGEVDVTDSEMNRGICGATARSQKRMFLENARKDARYCPGVDIEMPPNGRLYSAPIVNWATKRVTAVIQWVCGERSSIQFGDDGTFNEGNDSHEEVLQQYLLIIECAIQQLWPIEHRVYRTLVERNQLSKYVISELQEKFSGRSTGIALSADSAARYIQRYFRHKLQRKLETEKRKRASITPKMLSAVGRAATTANVAKLSMPPVAARTAQSPAVHELNIGVLRRASLRLPGMTRRFSSLVGNKPSSPSAGSDENASTGT